MKRLILILATLLLCSSAWAATKVQVMTGGKIDVDKLPTIDFSLETDPASPEDGRIWWNETEKLLKISDSAGIYTFTGVLAAWDTTPAAFTFTDITNATTETLYTSNAITVSGINHPAAISVSGDASAKYSVNNTTAVSTNGTVSAGDEVRAVVTSSASDGTAVNATVLIGGVSDAFSVTTAAGEASGLPDAFDTDTLASNYTQLNSSYSVVHDGTNYRVKGGTVGQRSGAYYNTPMSGSYYVQGKVYAQSLSGSTAGGLVVKCNGDGATSTGMFFQPSGSWMRVFGFSNGVASYTEQSGFNYPGGKTWTDASSHLVRVAVSGSDLTVYVDWNDDGDFEDTDEMIGMRTDATYSGGYGGVYFYSNNSWVDDFDMGGL